MGPGATTVLWSSPECSAADSSEALEMARACRSRWRTRGIDCQSKDRLLEAAQSLHEGGLFAKSKALSTRIMNGLGIAVKTEETPDNSVTIRVALYGTGGGAVEHADVVARFVPGTYEWLPLASNGAGTWERQIPVAELPRQYDMDKRAYLPLTGPVRVMIRARSGTQQDSATSLITLGQ
jgi:hypothetical protein